MQPCRECTLHMDRGLCIQAEGRVRDKLDWKERNGNIMVEFCCSSQLHALSIETKQRAHLGNYWKIETEVQRHMCLYLSHQGLCATYSSNTTPSWNVYFLVRSRTDWEPGRQRWGSGKHRKKKWWGGNQMQQMHVGKKEDRLAAKQKEMGRQSFSQTGYVRHNRKVDFSHIFGVLLKS